MAPTGAGWAKIFLLGPIILIAGIVALVVGDYVFGAAAMVVVGLGLGFAAYYKPWRQPTDVPSPLT